MWIVDLLQTQTEHVPWRNHALSPMLQVLADLRFYATGSFQSVLGDTIQVHKSTVSRVVEKISAIQFIQFPDNDDFAEISRQFFAIAGFPGVIGAIDGTHILILAPSEFEETFVNRKNNHSINMQVLPLFLHLIHTPLLPMDILATEFLIHIRPMQPSFHPLTIWH